MPSQFKTPAVKASALVVLVAVIQWLIAQWTAIETLLLSLNVSVEFLATVKTFLVLLLTLFGGFGVYKVAKGAG